MADNRTNGAPSHVSRYVASGGAAVLALSFLTVATWRGLDAAVDPAAHSAASAQAPVTAVTPATANGLVTSYAPILKGVTPGVVTVRVETKATPTPTGGQMPDLRDFFGPGFRMAPQQPHKERGLGSGVIVRGDGYILTNNHVIDGAEQIKVELPDKRVLEAKLIGADPATDLAVIKVTGANLHTVPLGDSDKVQVGDVVLAVGNPLGIGQTVTMGIVSAKGRTTGGLGDSFEDFLQTDAPINRGNSGGALVNTQGQLVGINSQIVSPSGGNIGLGFSIPVNMARNVMDQLIKTGSVQRAKLGVAAQMVTSDVAASLGLPEVKGALVANVEPGSAADRAGVKQGDVILDVDGRAVSDSNELRNAISSTAPGTTVALRVVRDGKEQTIKATLGELTAKKESLDARNGDGQSGGAFGMSVEPLTSENLRELDLPRGTTGVVVTDVDPDGQAASSGVRPGDVIQKVNGKDVSTVSDLKAALNAASNKPALVLVNRDKTGLFLTLQAPRG